MTTDPLEAPTSPPQPTAHITLPGVLPGRDLAVLLILAALLDVSGLLHVYGLSSLYGEEFFFGLGALVVLIALALLLWPSQPFKWLMRKSRESIAGPVAWISLGVVLATLGIWQVLVAVEQATAAVGVPVTQPISEQQKLALFGLGGIVLVAFAAAYARNERARRRWILLAGAAWFGLSVSSFLARLPDVSWGSYIACIWGCLSFMLGVVVLTWLVRPLSPGLFLGMALVVGGGLRLIAFGELPVTLSLKMGDMLPLINVSTARLLDGGSPYHLYQMPYDLPLTYWPLNLLPYVPFRALGLDLRLANLLFGLAVGGILLWLRRSAFGSEPGWACYAFGALYLTPAMFNWDLVTAAPPFWMWLCILMAVVAWDYVPDERQWLAEEPSLWERVRAHAQGAALGAAFAAGPLALPFAPFVVLWWLRRGWRYMARQVGVAVGVGAAAVLPFALWDLDAFWLGAVSWFNDLGQLPLTMWNFDQTWLREVGIAGQVWKAGLEEWLKPIQLFLLGGLAVASWGRLSSPADVLRWGSAAYILFMAFNPVIWPYLYTPALLGLVFTLAARGRDVAESVGLVGWLVGQQQEAALGGIEHSDAQLAPIPNEPIIR